MTDRHALLAAVIANPADDTPRLVFADWCEENGEEPRAEYIRWSIRSGWVHQFAMGDAAQVDVDLDGTERARQHMESIACEIQGAPKKTYIPIKPLRFADPIPGVKWTVRRGFADGVWITAEDWGRLGDELVERYPIQSVQLMTRLRFDWHVVGNYRSGIPGCRRFLSEQHFFEKKIMPEEVLPIHVLQGLWPSIPDWRLLPESTYERGERLYGSPRRG
jgi:uncharacterized protein (TIGR02996 family)